MTSKDLLEELEDVGVALRSLGISAVNHTGDAATVRPVTMDRRLATRIANAVSAATNALEKPEQSADPVGPVDDLSNRQKEILSWVALGKSNSVIASILGISPHTVDTHIRRIFDRLGTTDRTVAAIRGVQTGLIAPAGLLVA